MLLFRSLSAHFTATNVSRLVYGMAAGQAASSAAQGLLSRAAAAAGVGALAGAEAAPAGVLGGTAIGAVGSMIV